MSLDLREIRQLSDAAEVIAVILPSFFQTVICTNLSAALIEGTGNVRMKNVFLDFIVLVIPTVLSCTLLSHYLSIVNMVAFSTAILVTCVNHTRIKKTKVKPEVTDVLWETVVNRKAMTKIYYLSSTRSIINLITVVCILAVDFDFFPHRFSKTAHYGVSLMDVGVGLYVYANGIVAYEIRGVKHSIRTTFINVLPILAIGIARFVATYLIGYHVNPNEYGIHWNFFITLGVTKLISALIMTRIVPKFLTCLAIGIGIVTMHQCILYMGIEQYIVSDIDRDNLISANREGLGSCLGYIGLYFISVATGFILHNVKSKRRIYSEMMIGICLLIIATGSLHRLFNISRCMANSTYVAWILLIAYFMTFLLFLYEEFLKHFYAGTVMVFAPQLFEAINYNGLAYFLIANLITGFVNLTIDTHKVGEMSAFIVMLLYMMICSLLVVFLYHKKIKLKL